MGFCINEDKSVLYLRKCLEYFGNITDPRGNDNYIAYIEDRENSQSRKKLFHGNRENLECGQSKWAFGICNASSRNGETAL